MSVFAMIIAAIISEDILKVRFPNKVMRRIGAVIAAIGVATLLFFVWSSNEFVPVKFPMMFIIMVGLALSVGFMISYMVLNVTLNWGTIWERRTIGYFIGTRLVPATSSISNPDGSVNVCAPILKSTAESRAVEPRASETAVMSWRMAVTDSSAVPSLGQAELPSPCGPELTLGFRIHLATLRRWLRNSPIAKSAS
jgi:hypothetical protein